jgi:type II secretory pathway component PulL
MKFASFDSNRLVEDLVAKRVSRKRATEIASGIAEALAVSETDLATRSDLEAMEKRISEIHQAIQTIPSLQDEWLEACMEMNSLKNELRAGHLALVKWGRWLVAGLLVALVLVAVLALIVFAPQLGL